MLTGISKKENTDFSEFARQTRLSWLWLTNRNQHFTIAVYGISYDKKEFRVTLHKSEAEIPLMYGGLPLLSWIRKGLINEIAITEQRDKNK